VATVHIINPGSQLDMFGEDKPKPKTVECKTSRGCAGGGSMSGKKKSKGKGKKRTTNPAPTRRKSNAAPAPTRRRKRRKANPAPKRRRRRSNPSLGDVRGGLMKMLPDVKEILGYVGVNMAINFAVLRFGSTGALLGGSASPTMGAAWTGRNYAIGLGAAYLISKLAPQLKMDGRTLFRDGVKSLVSRMVWTEGLARSKWMRDTFGAALQVQDDRYGNRWLTLPDGSQLSMAGLSAASPMGGLQAASVYGNVDAYEEPIDELADEASDELDLEEELGNGNGTLAPTRSIDAGGYLLPGGGRRFQNRGDEAYRNHYRRFTPFAPF